MQAIAGNVVCATPCPNCCSTRPRHVTRRRVQEGATCTRGVERASRRVGATQGSRIHGWQRTGGAEGGVSIVVMSSPRFAIQRSDVPRPVLATRAVGVVSERMLGVLTLACQAGGPRHRISGLPARIGVRTMTPLLLRLQSRSTEHHDSRPRALVPVGDAGVRTTVRVGVPCEHASVPRGRMWTVGSLASRRSAWLTSKNVLPHQLSLGGWPTLSLNAATTIVLAGCCSSSTHGAEVASKKY